MARTHRNFPTHNPNLAPLRKLTEAGLVVGKLRWSAHPMHGLHRVLYVRRESTRGPVVARITCWFDPYNGKDGWQCEVPWGDSYIGCLRGRYGTQEYERGERLPETIDRAVDMVLEEV